MRRASAGRKNSGANETAAATRSWNDRRLAREIIHEDSNIIVINKGYGLTVQGDAQSLVHALPVLALRRTDQLRHGPVMPC